MSLEDDAYRAAQDIIAEARRAGETGLSFDTRACRSLTRIPPELADLPELREVDFNGTRITDLAPLTSVTQLQTLWLDGTRIIDLGPLTTLTGLRTLKLDGTRIIDLAPLTTITGLRSLMINGTRISDLSPIRTMTALHHLGVTATRITDISPLTSLIDLQSLTLTATRITDLAPLTKLSELRTLGLASTPITDLAPLTTLSGLQILWLNDTKITDLRPIRDLPFIERDLPMIGLRFSNTPATAQDAELARLAEIEDDEERTHSTLAYLKTLPPWPQPYTPRARPDSQPPQPIGREDTATLPAVRTAEVQIKSLLRHALITRVTADTLSRQIADALRDVPATNGNELAPILQMMAEVGEVLGHLAENAPLASTKDREHALLLRISHLESLVTRLTAALKNEEEARKAAEALAKKESFVHAFRKSAGTAAGAGSVALIGVGVPTAAVYFRGADHPLVTAFLTVIGKLPKG
jgi:Leucine-rich repeat (LRR) protein